MTYRWTYEPSGESEAFASQDEAEAWLGREFESLREDGVSSVTLYDGDTEVYGPMSLDPA